MTISLPTIDPYDYHQVEDANNKKALEMFEALFPELRVPVNSVFQIISFLQETQVNAMILPRVIRGIYNISLGTGEGDVIIHVRKDIVTMETREREGEVRVKNIK